MFRNFNHVIGTQGEKNNGRKLIKRIESKRERERRANYGSIFTDTLPKKYLEVLF